MTRLFFLGLFIVSISWVAKGQFEYQSDSARGFIPDQVVVEIPTTEASKDSLNTLGLTIRLACYPNPTETTTTIIYTLPQKGLVHISLVTKKGIKVKTIVSLVQESGQHEYSVDLSSQKKGLYFVIVHTNYTKQSLPVFLY